MIAEISIIPLGHGVSVSEYVAKAVGIIDRSGLEYKVTNFGTEVEGDWDAVMKVVKECHYSIMKEADAGRIITHIVIDERADKKYSLGDKIRAVEKRLGKEVKK